MQRQLRFPIISRISIFILAGCSLLSSYGAKVPFETIGFVPVEGGASIDEGLDLFLMTFDQSAFEANNPSDIVLLRGFNLINRDVQDEDDEDDDTFVYASSYTGYHSSSQTELDSGRLLFESDDIIGNLSAEGVVGFFRKSSAWVKQGEAEENLMASLKGTIEYQSLESTRDVTIDATGSYQGEAFALRGKTTIQVTSDGITSLNAWVADDSSDRDFSFGSSLFRRKDDTNVYEGYVARTDSEDPDSWKTRYALMRIVDTNDSDGDGIPDFSDTGAGQILSVIEANSVSMGDGKVWSNDLNTTVTIDPQQLWLYGENLGWFYLPAQDDASNIRLYIPDENLGWIATNKELSPYYVRESDGAQLFFDVIDNQVWYYDYSSETWNTPVY